LLRFEDVVQSLLNMCLHDVCSWSSLNHLRVKYRGLITKNEPLETHLVPYVACAIGIILVPTMGLQHNRVLRRVSQRGTKIVGVSLRVFFIESS
jgi:hypothetical protein